MWIEMDGVVINLNTVTSFAVYEANEYSLESLVINTTTTDNHAFYDNCKERYAKLKEILFNSGEYYGYELLKM